MELNSSGPGQQVETIHWEYFYYALIWMAPWKPRNRKKIHHQIWHYNHQHAIAEWHVLFIKYLRDNDRTFLERWWNSQSTEGGLHNKRLCERLQRTAICNIPVLRTVIQFNRKPDHWTVNRLRINPCRP